MDDITEADIICKLIQSYSVTPTCTTPPGWLQLNTNPSLYARPKLTSVHSVCVPAHAPCSLHRPPARPPTATVEFDHTGDYLATGDKGGRVVLFERNETKKGCEYKFYTEFQSHEPEFDYLKSLEIEEKINKIRWCKRQNAAHFLLSTNGKQQSTVNGLLGWTGHGRRVGGVAGVRTRLVARAGGGAPPPNRQPSAVVLTRSRLVTLHRQDYQVVESV